MPILTRVDHARRLVITKASGVLHDQEMTRYLRTIWSRPEVAGFDELVDITGVEQIALPSLGRARELASLSFSMDRPASPDEPERLSRFAIVAPAAIAVAIDSMYRTLRAMQPKKTREVAVFKTMAEAQVFLGVEGPIEV